MENIVFTLEFSDLQASERANEQLAKGWTLLHVGTINTQDTNENGIPYLYTAYVVGANKEQYNEYLQEQNRITNFDSKEFLADFLNSDEN